MINENTGLITIYEGCVIITKKQIFFPRPDHEAKKLNKFHINIQDESGVFTLDKPSMITINTTKEIARETEGREES